MQHAQALAGGSVAAGQASARLCQPLPRHRELLRVLQLEQAPAATEQPVRRVVTKLTKRGGESLWNRSSCFLDTIRGKHGLCAAGCY